MAQSDDTLDNTLDNTLDDTLDDTPDAAPGEQPAEPLSVKHEIDLDAPLDDVWSAITDPSRLGEWLGGDVDLEVRPAAAGRVVGDDGTHYAVLVTDVDDRRRVAWHWWDDQGTLSSVELTLEPVGDATRLRVTETLVETLVATDASAARAAGCARRWERATSRLWSRATAHAVAW